MKKNKPVLLVLGAGRLQKKTIREAEESGIRVVAVDSNKKAPGRCFATFKPLISAIDYEANLRIARKYDIDGVLTTGTDQPVAIVSRIAHKLRIPAFISVNTSILATNKEKMKEAFKKYKIPSSAYRIVKSLRETQKLRSLKFPVVIKPVDSQGQRGVFFIDNFELLINKIQLSLEYSTVRKVIIEDYIEGPEITASVWVHQGMPYLIMLTDRIIYNNLPHIGLCLAHIFPSRHAIGYTGKIKQVIARLVRSFKISNGPVYIQMIISKRGPLIGEIACRIGGGHEEDLIPLVTGFDIRRHLIGFSIGNALPVNKRDFNINDPFHKAVFFLGASKDIASEFIPMEEQVTSSDFMGGEFYIQHGSKVNNLQIGTDRIGYFMVKGRDRKALIANAKDIYAQLKIPGKKNKNLIENIFDLPLRNI
ncbi:MAG: ATP-grasp domain-containing protein [Nitrospirae bacterium]|nr:ATP-grasp domain-containing protein [Nitrospirota bacterium]